MRDEILFGFIIVIAIGTIVAYVRRGHDSLGGSGFPVGFDEIPLLVEKLTRTGREGSFAVILFGRNGARPAERDALNVQFSIERGRPGLDWVLLAPSNIAARKDVTRYLERQGYKVSRREENDVKYLRTEGEHLANLCQNLLQEQFGVKPEQQFDLIVDGFDWSK